MNNKTVNPIGIIDIATHIPESCLKVIDCCNLIGITPIQAKIYSQFYKIPNLIIAREQTLLEFISKPLTKLLLLYPEIRETTTLIIYAHTGPISCEFGSSIIKVIQQHFGFKRALTFGTTLYKCVGSIKSLEIVAQFFTRNQKTDTAIILCGEIACAKSVRHVPNTSISGDACVAVLLGNSKYQHQLIACNTNVDGRFAKGIWMNPAELTSFDKQYIPYLTSTITRALASNHLSLNDISMIIPHNINLPSWTKVAKALGISIDKIYLDNVQRIGHILGADVFINLATALANNQIKPHDQTLMFSVGIGASYGYALWQH